ncbi:caspase family protein [Priestia koreensis]|uniref:caspase family protein n=1 Tax=Priestia koreensis TaxID=284581 RepID=UPI00301B47CC
MSNERRFAIVIGINDYEINPLNYCENDAVFIKEKLVNNCRFDEEDVYLITSTCSNPNKEITGKYKEAIRIISQDFRPNEDSILFYFAGHGFYREEQSIIQFHDSEYPIVEIFKDVSILKPKVQFYIIDSCQSGGKVLTRGDQALIIKDALIEKYLESSEGAMLLYACGSNQYARETSEMQHGLLTYEFLNAIDNEELYDEDGILTPSRIQDFVLKQTSKASNFEQIPVVENRITGIYPFALKEPKIYEVSLVNEKENIANERNQRILYNKNSRLQLQEFISLKVSEKIDKTLTQFKDSYSETLFDINELKLENKEKILERLVINARENNLSPINNIYYTEKTMNSAYVTQRLSSMFKAFQSKDVPEYYINHYIDTEDEYITNKIYVLSSEDIYSVSFGCGFIVYQSKWGLVLTTLIFKIEWDGEKDSIIETILKNDYPFLIAESTYKSVENLEIENFSNVGKTLGRWNRERKEELEAFMRTTISTN